MDYQFIRDVALIQVTFLLSGMATSFGGTYLILRASWRLALTSWSLVWLLVFCFAFLPTVIGCVMHSENDRFVLGILFWPLAWCYPAGIAASWILATFIRQRSQPKGIAPRNLWWYSTAGVLMAAVGWIIVFQSWGFEKPRMEAEPGPPFPTPYASGPTR